MKNAVGWFEIPATDISRARAFYETALGINMQETTLANGLKMAVFQDCEGNRVALRSDG